LWHNQQGPAEDRLATDSAALHAGRARVLEATLIIPGHGTAFAPDPSTQAETDPTGHPEEVSASRLLGR
jgi:hypothetical protein